MMITPKLWLLFVQRSVPVSCSALGRVRWEERHKSATWDPDTSESERDETLRVDCSFNAVLSRPSWLVNTRAYIDLFGCFKPTAWMPVLTVESPHRTFKISLAGSQIVWVDWRWMPGPRCSVLGPFHPGLTIWHISHLASPHLHIRH